jgi:hypothetical protein
MAEDGQASAATAVSENATIVAAELHADDHPHGANANKQAPDGADVKAEDADGPLSPRLNAPLPFGRNHTKVLSLDDYFVSTARALPCSPAENLRKSSVGGT